LAEDQSFINVREVEDWCKECREYKPPVLNATTFLAISLGALVGFLPALAATDSKRNGVWWGIFLLGSIIAGVGCIIALLAMVIEMPRVRKKLHREHRPSTHERLADRMEGASEKGRLRAAAAEEALRAEEEKREGKATA
jgi:MFS family permease